MSHNTGNDLESSDILDFEDNCENLDILMNADQDYWTDRLGNKRPTIDYALRMAGFTPAGFDFTTGGVLKNGDRNKCVFNQADQTWYSWSGNLPYNVIGGSVPGEGWKVCNYSLKTVPLCFTSVDSIKQNLLFNGCRVVVDNYHESGNSGPLFFTVVMDESIIPDGGKHIKLSNGMILKQNLRLPVDPRAWGAVGDGDRNNVEKDTSALQNALNYGPTHLRDGKYVINKTIFIYNGGAVTSDSLARLEFINDSGPCIHLNNDSSVHIENSAFNIRIIDNGKDRQNTWSVICERVATSDLCFEIIPGEDYYANYSHLTTEQQLDLKFGLNIKNRSFSNSIKSKLYQSSLLLEAADNDVVEPSIIWANGRRWAIKLLTASTRIEGVQLVPGSEYGIYSDAPDITHTQIVDNYFDGNTKPQSEIPTGHVIYFTGNLRRSTIAGNRFFIPAKRSIHINGVLEASSISGGNVFSNGDAADLGFGDIYIGKSNGSVITGNSHFRDNLATKTGLARTQPPQPPIVIGNIGSEYDEPTIVSDNSLMGVNFYTNSLYPSVSSILTKNNHGRFHNYGTFVCRYSDKQELKVYQTTLSQLQLDALPHGEVYTNSLASLGITSPDDPSGYVKTTRLQDSINLSFLPYGRQEIHTNNNKIYTRMLVNNVWGAFREI